MWGDTALFHQVQMKIADIWVHGFYVIWFRVLHKCFVRCFPSSLQQLIVVFLSVKLLQRACVECHCLSELGSHCLWIWYAPFSFT
jgi:hypothetical protein